MSLISSVSLSILSILVLSLDTMYGTDEMCFHAKVVFLYNLQVPRE
jgi:hypothetical protein